MISKNVYFCVMQFRQKSYCTIFVRKYNYFFSTTTIKNKKIYLFNLVFYRISAICEEKKKIIKSKNCLFDRKILMYQ